MTLSKSNRITTALVTGVAAGALGLAAVATPAQAATGDTAGIRGALANNVASGFWYDDGAYPPGAHTGTPSNVTLTTTQTGSTINFELVVDAGPVQAATPASANAYRLDAYVRLDGAVSTRGTQFAGPVGTVVVNPGQHTFASGATITGSFPGVSAGQHKLTLTDLALNSNGPSSSPSGNGTFGGALMGFDATYNAGSDFATIYTTPTDWPVTQSITVTDKIGPFVGVTVPGKPTKAKSWKTIKGTATDASGVKSVTLELSQKRSGGSYYYTGKKWKKGKASKAKAVAAKVSGSTWSASIKKPGKGKMTIEYKGVDKVGNGSASRTYTTKKLK